MNENAKKWVEALRSGNYKKTVGQLSNEYGYCCLGVACDLYEKETGDELPKSEDGDYDDVYLYGDFSCVKEWLGLRNGDGSYGDDDSLAKYNDGGKTFNQIADIIESQTEGLFIKGDI